MIAYIILGGFLIIVIGGYRGLKNYLHYFFGVGSVLEL